jgi:hypothetical protein
VKPRFSQFSDDLLMAMVDAGQKMPGHYINPIAVAIAAKLSHMPGWVRQAVEALQSKGWVSAKFLATGQPDGQVMAIVTGRGVERAEKIEEERRQAASAEDEVPASDRFVRIDHNSAGYKDADDALGQTLEAVRGSNEYRSSDPEDHEQRVAELEAGKRLLQAPRVDLGWLKAGLERTLTYIAKKFADQAIGKLAGAAIKFLLALVHVSM